MTPAEKVKLEARLAVIEHLLAMQFASDFMTGSPDPVGMARNFAATLRQTLETPQASGLSPELSALAHGEIGDQADRIGKAIVALVLRHEGSS